MSLSVILGSILSAGIFIIQFIMNDTIRREEDIENILELIHGEIAFANGEKKNEKVGRYRNNEKIKMHLLDMSDYRLVEGLNQLKTNLAFCGDGIKTITVTSSVPNEGEFGRF